MPTLAQRERVAEGRVRGFLRCGNRHCNYLVGTLLPKSPFVKEALPQKGGNDHFASSTGNTIPPSGIRYV